MKILWLCNIMLPQIAEVLGKEVNNKEGWLSGLSQVILSHKEENEIELAVAFPFADRHELGDKKFLKGKVADSGLVYYGFYEDVRNPERCSKGLSLLELSIVLEEILEDYKPDILHCFGTEYPHTEAVSIIYESQKTLVGIQGLCSLCAEAYYADLPKNVINRVTFRDFVKKDSIKQQRHKFQLRGESEIRAIVLGENYSGRTAWDKQAICENNPDANYFFMNETLRSNFYQGEWSEDKCIKHSIFVSQGDYPLKGLHYMLIAMGELKEKYPDVKLYVAGNSLVRYETLKDKIKISSYGKYLRELIKEYRLENMVEFTGRLTAEQMKDRFLKSNVFVCCSSLENSPNSLGEAMILGCPCVTSDVGGITSIFDSNDGFFYEGYRNNREDLTGNAHRLAEAVDRAFSDKEEVEKRRLNAREHALKTHDPENNYKRLLEIYQGIYANNQE